MRGLSWQLSVPFHLPNWHIWSQLLSLKLTFNHPHCRKMIYICDFHCFSLFINNNIGFDIFCSQTFFRFSKYDQSYAIFPNSRALSNILGTIYSTKPASHCPILKSWIVWDLGNIIQCDSCLFRFHPIPTNFSFQQIAYNFSSVYPRDVATLGGAGRLRPALEPTTRHSESFKVFRTTLIMVN